MYLVCLFDQCYADGSHGTGERKERKKMKNWKGNREWNLYSRFNGCLHLLCHWSIQCQMHWLKKGKEENENLRKKERMNSVFKIWWLCIWYAFDQCNARWQRWKERKRRYWKTEMERENESVFNRLSSTDANLGKSVKC